ncbi:MAG: transglycosylase domain-containing protein [Patescibacteria group bacterium]|nr:transglycosylase domain-containing protein [Patescibacteria group bacterium]MDE2438498.1 transglycosylase domain-containing protein [Patescibacteria group bacterium]
MTTQKNKKRSFMKFLLIGGVCIAFLIFFGIFVLITYETLTLPQVDNFSDQPAPQTTKIYDRTGQVLLYDLYGDQKRTPIAFDEIPDYVKKATLALEDKDFYNHSAFSIKGTLRALVTDIIQGQTVEGGSTITQQLVKNTLLDPQKTITRKIKEIILAYKLERRYSKDEILNLYLNDIPYGGNAYGIEAASQSYFNKSAKDLTLAEAAILASLPQAPSYYSPYGIHKQELLNRAHYGLKIMKDLGWITDTEYNNALQESITFAPQKVSIRAPHFVMMVIDYLNKQYGEDYVKSAGLNVITTLDWPTQQIAEDVVARGAQRNTELYKGTNAALVSEDPKTGQIISLVGSHDYFDVAHDGNFDVATQGLRQPGSSFKPFVYLTAFTKGYTPQTIVFDLPTEFDTSGDPHNSYRPENFDGQFGGPTTLRDALGNSLNVPSVKVLYLAGIKDVINMAQKFGITTLNDPNRYGLSLVLGGGEVKLIDMVNAYSILSQEGTEHKQQFILSVTTNDGKVLETYNDTVTPVVDPQYTREITDILSSDSARSRLFSPHGPLYFQGYDVAAKTGTTNDYRDAWVFAYTPNIVTGIWAGNNDNTPMQKSAGSILAAVPMLNDFYTQILPTRPNEKFTPANPVSSKKPMLNGQYIIPITGSDGKSHDEIHSILYYVNKDDPQGNYPDNPNIDPQFKNWEQPVAQWAAKHFSATSINTLPQNYINTILQTDPQESNPIQISINNPKNGDYISSPFSISSTFNAIPQSIKIFFNNVLIQEISNPSSSIHLTVSSTEIQTQNSLRIEVMNKLGVTSSKEIILFKK